MGIFTLPIAYIGGLLFTLFVVILFTAGSFAFNQMWTHQALEKSTSAAMTQVDGDKGNNPYLPSTSQVLNVVDAKNVANQVWWVQPTYTITSGGQTFEHTQISMWTPTWGKQWFNNSGQGVVTSETSTVTTTWTK